jgi:hypothetical protein
MEKGRIEVLCADREKDGFVESGIRVLVGLDGFREALRNTQIGCLEQRGHRCLIKIMKAAAETGKVNAEEVREIITKKYASEDKFDSNYGPNDPIDVVSAILTEFHLAFTKKSCDSPIGEIAPEECGFNCLLHSDFYLGVVETHKCHCGYQHHSSWDPANICQYFNLTPVLEKFDYVLSENISKLPAFLLKTGKFEGNSGKFKDDILNQLTNRLENAVSDECPNNCAYQNVKISFEVTHNPKFFILNMVWGEQNILHLHSLLTTLAISSSFKTIDVYGNGENAQYLVNSIIFYGRGHFEHAEYIKGKWIFNGLHKDAGFFELVKEVTLMNYHPVAVIYKVILRNEELNQELDPGQKLKLEKLAWECDEYVKSYGQLIIEPDKTISGLNNEARANMRKSAKAEEEKVEPEYKTEQFIGVKQIRQYPIDGAKKGIQENLLQKFDRADDIYKSSPEKKIDSPKTWKCICGRQNNIDTEVCFICYEIKEGLTGWVCENCKIRNSLEYKSCLQCKSLRRAVELRKTISGTQEEKVNFDNNRKVQTIEVDKRNKSPLTGTDKFESSTEKKVSTWECECGAANDASWDICHMCERIKPGLTGWVCKLCKARNDSHSYRCSACENWKGDDSNKYQQYWICKKCKTANLEAAGMCAECLSLKPSQEGKMSTDTNEKGIWKCGYCYRENFPDFTECFHCNTVKGENFPGTRKVTKIAGSSEKWVCKTCKSSNDSTAYICVKCRTFKEIEKEETEPEENKRVKKDEDDKWMCNCNTVNENWRSMCKSCYTHKIDVQPKRKPVVDKWTCKNCSAENIGSRFCSNCLQDKDSEVEVPEEKKCMKCRKAIRVVNCNSCGKATRLSRVCAYCNTSLISISTCSSCQDSEKEVKTYDRYSARSYLTCNTNLRREFK